jgi:hypothetical protein
MGRGCGVSANEYSCTHGAQINVGDLTPYLTYESKETKEKGVTIKFAPAIGCEGTRCSSSKLASYKKKVRYGAAFCQT